MILSHLHRFRFTAGEGNTRYSLCHFSLHFRNYHNTQRRLKYYCLEIDALSAKQHAKFRKGDQRRLKRSTDRVRSEDFKNIESVAVIQWGDSQYYPKTFRRSNNDQTGDADMQLIGGFLILHCIAVRPR